MPKVLFFILLMVVFGCHEERSQEVSYEIDGDSAICEVNGKSIKDGLCKRFYSSGRIAEEAFYVDGVMDGRQKLYYENGNLWVTRNIDMGRIRGEYKEYYSDGTIKVHALDRRVDRDVGSVYYYHENGTLGLYEYWDLKGFLAYEEEYDSVGSLMHSEGHTLPVVFLTSVFGETARYGSITCYCAMAANPPSVRVSTKLHRQNETYDMLRYGNYSVYCEHIDRVGTDSFSAQNTFQRPGLDSVFIDSVCFRIEFF